MDKDEGYLVHDCDIILGCLPRVNESNAKFIILRIQQDSGSVETFSLEIHLYQISPSTCHTDSQIQYKRNRQDLIVRKSPN